MTIIPLLKSLSEPVISLFHTLLGLVGTLSSFTTFECS
jgi:hypothetical protein